MSHEETSEEENLPKLSVKELLRVVPPPQVLREEKRKTVSEKRVRVKYMDTVKEGFIGINPRLANLLNIESYAEISVKNKRLRFQVVILEDLPEDVIAGNSEELKRNGIADGSLVVVRRAQ